MAASSLPDTQLAYLFLHRRTQTCLRRVEFYACFNSIISFTISNHLASDGVFLKNGDVREVLDFVSIRGMFQKGKADTKVVVVVVEAEKPPRARKILHATFRRSGRVDAEQGFDIDYYDLHWIPRDLALSNDAVWRTDLLGGGAASLDSWIG